MKDSPMTATAEKPNASVTFSMPKDCKVKLNSMPSMTGDSVSVTIQGEITSISDDKHGKNFSMEPDSIKVSGEKKMTMAEELSKVKGGRKYKNQEQSEGE